MAASYPTQTPGTLDSSSDPGEFTFTVPGSLSDALLVVAIGNEDVGDFSTGIAPDDVTYDFGGGATSMTKLADLSESEGAASISIWVAAIGTTSGSVDISCDGSTDGTDRWLGCGFVLAGVDQTTPEHATPDEVISSGDNTDLDITVAGADNDSDEIVVGIMQTGNTISSPPGTEIHGNNKATDWYGGNFSCCYIAGTGSDVDFDWTGSDSYWRAIAVSFQAAAAGGGPTIPKTLALTGVGT